LLQGKHQYLLLDEKFKYYFLLVSSANHLSLETRWIL
jgi:hypothetical protein